ncbi:MAG: hypothetical protein PHQ89_00165 [Bacilli bacterium]|nr:hypothetical protein [Bacilli bacterium]
MKTNNKKLMTMIMVIFILVIIILLLNFCSNQKDNNVDSYSNVKGINQPILLKGMTAVKFDGNDWVEINDPDTDDTWYNYKKTTNNNLNTSEWANAKTSDGSMWVWIPRYAYKITNNSIDIIFLKNNDVDVDNNYIIHPSFTNNVSNGGWDEEIPGFWVSKYEAGIDDNEKLVFNANVYSYSNVDISESYSLCKNLDYNNGDSHLIKNSEWGAVAYLSQSPYGRNGIEVSINRTKVTISEDESYAVTAGGNGTDGLAASEKEALINNAKQSTTGNAYGVYDMSGGLWERVAAYINNGNVNLLKNGKAVVEDGKASQSSKYKTVYSYDKDNDIMENNYNINKNIIGDAIFETSTGLGEKSWFNDYSSFMFENSPFLHRGGTYSNTTGAGLFAFSNTPGQAYKTLGFRCAIVIE